MKHLCSLLHEFGCEYTLQEDALVVSNSNGARLEFYDEMDELTMCFGGWHRHYGDGADPSLVEDLQYLFGNIHCVINGYCDGK